MPTRHLDMTLGHATWIWHVAGTVNYVKDEWSPTAAEVDCLGSGDEDIDREGRYGLPTLTSSFASNASHTCTTFAVQSLDRMIVPDQQSVL